MIVTSWRLLRYRLPLRRPLTTGACGFREGLIVELTEESGVVGRGEAAPLPGLHTDDIDALIPALRGGLRTGPVRGLASQSLPLVGQFAIESAALTMSAAKFARPPEFMLSGSPARWIPVNGLITGGDPLVQAQQQVAAGYQTLKLKVGRGPVDEEVALVKQLRALVGPEVALRLDANRAWSLPAAIRFCHGIAGQDIAYIEEPLADPQQLSALHRQTGVPLALDESLLDLPAVEGLVALVIKPSVLGMGRTMKLIAAAKERGLTPVISAAFESAVGMVALTALAASIGEGLVAQGLGTSDWLAEDVMPPPVIEDGGIALSLPRSLLRTAHIVEIAFA